MEKEKKELDRPMTLGDFADWLKDDYIPHSYRDEQQSNDLKDIFIAVKGNGTPEHGMQFKVDKMWDIAQRIEHFFSAGKMLWFMIVSILMASAAAASLGKSMGWW